MLQKLYQSAYIFIVVFNTRSQRSRILLHQFIRRRFFAMFAQQMTNTNQSVRENGSIFITSNSLRLCCSELFQNFDKPFFRKSFTSCLRYTSICKVTSTNAFHLTVILTISLLLSNQLNWCQIFYFICFIHVWVC